MGKNSGNGNGVCRSLGAMIPYGGLALYGDFGLGLFSYVLFSSPLAML